MSIVLRTSLNRILYTPYGQTLFSALLGLAFALLFNRVCKSGCTVYYAPHIDEINDKIFKLEDTCYKYTPYVVDCRNKQNILLPYDINANPINKIKKIQSNISEN